jgi:hypothetical protein
LVRAVLEEHELLHNDSTPSIRTWIDQVSAELPDGFGGDIRAWFVEPHEGGVRARLRSPSTVYAYFGRVRPHLLAWSDTRERLREVTRDDVVETLDGLRGHARAGTFTALRSLFGFARRRRLVFLDPTRRLHVGRASVRSVLPLTDDQTAAIARGGDPGAAAGRRARGRQCRARDQAQIPQPIIQQRRGPQPRERVGVHYERASGALTGGDRGQRELRASCWLRHPSSIAVNTCSSGRSSGTPLARCTRAAPGTPTSLFTVDDSRPWFALGGRISHQVRDRQHGGRSTNRTSGSPVSGVRRHACNDHWHPR